MCLRKWIQKLFAPKPLAEAVTEIIQSEEELTAPTLTEMKFYVVVPAAATNYVTNPTPYRATTGYTAFDPDSAGTIAIAGSDTYTRRGPKCIKITTLASHDAGVYFSSVTGADGTTYTFSADVLTTAGEAMVLAICSDVAGTILESTTFTSTGYWQRQEVSLTGTSGNAGTWYLHLYRDGASPHAYDIYTDGWQFEVASAATTFFSGDTKGFGIAPLEFYWGGTPHASVSYRTADTRAGGSLLDLETYAVVSAGFGLGMGNFNQIYNELASGGAYYQKHIRKPRNFSLLLSYYGDNAGDLHDKRNAVIEAVRPDYTGYDQPLIIRYQGENSSGYEATNPVDIICIPQPSHADLPDNSRLQTNEVLNFTVLDSYLTGAYAEGKELRLYDELTLGDYLVYRDANGAWHDVDNSGTGITDTVRVIVEAPNKEIIIGGAFSNAGNITEADFLCKWTGTVIDDVTGAAHFNNDVHNLCYDSEGNLYIGGEFTDAGDGNGDYIVKWNGTALSSLGTGAASAYVYSVVIEPGTGDIYVGGSFSGMGGVANTKCIAYYDISASAWKALGTGMGGTTGWVQNMAFAPNGDLYIVGNFLDVGGDANADYLCKWNGTAFSSVGNTALNSNAYGVALDKLGKLYITGEFTNVGGNADIDYFAMYDGNSWHSLNAGLNSAAYHIMTINNEIYISGAFTEAGGMTLTSKIVKYVNGAWQQIDFKHGTAGIILTMLKTSRNELFIGGSFTGTTYGCSQNTIINGGNSDTYPVIEVVGPGILQSIKNYTTNREIAFNNLNLLAGETVTLRLDPIDIEMTSTWGGRGNLLKYIVAGSDLGQFSLKSGTNYISLLMPSGTTAATKAYIYFTPKFWNIEGSRYE